MKEAWPVWHYGAMGFERAADEVRDFERSVDASGIRGMFRGNVLGLAVG